MLFRNPFGFSLTEVMVGLGVTALVGVVGFQMINNVEKDKVLVKTQSDSLLVETDLRGFFSKEGACTPLIGKAEGATNLVLQIGSRTYAVGSAIGSSEITGLSYKSYHPVSPDGLNGIARIELLMKSKTSNRGYRRMIPVGVQLKNGVIQNCDARMTDIYTKLADMVCENTYGADSDNKTCAEVVQMVKDAALTSICEDIYGTKTASYLAAAGKHCDLLSVHATDICPSGEYATGFDAQGKLQCDPSPFPLGAIPPPVFASCTGQSLGWLSNCSGPTIAGAHLSSQTISHTGSSAFMGGATATCYNGTWALSGANCDSTGCNPTTQGWDGNCTGNLPSTSNGSSAVVSNTASGFSGTATYTCNSGSWSAATGTSCNADCTTAPQSWLTNCSDSALAGSHGVTRPLSYTGGGYSGSATATCSNGAWILSGESCSTTGCSASTPKTWLTNCSASLPARAEGASATVTNSAAGFSGSATFACTGGVWQAPTGTSCKTDCSNESLSWLSNCSDNVLGGPDGTARTLSFTGGGYVGSATATCNNGVWNLSGQNCAAGGCNLTTKSWLTNCSATVPATAEGASATVSNSAAGFSGSATFACTSGTWQTPTGTSCKTDCSTETLTWNTNCSASATTGADGVVRSLSSSSGGWNGTATATCNNGVWNVSGSSCSQTDCAAGPQSWSTNCQASLPLRSSGNSVTVNNSAAGFSGSATFTCSNGTWQSPTGVSCNADCSTQNLPWMTNCSASASSGAHNIVRNISHSGGGFTGNANATCNNGTWSLSGQSCSASGCSSVSRNWGPNCSANLPATSEGASITVSSSASGSTGTATFTCSGGTFGAPTAYACHQNCPTQSLTWNTNCSASANSGVHGTVSSLTSTTAGFAGTATATCSDGTWNISGGSCASTDCLATSKTWLTNCSASLSQTGSGGTASVTNTVAGYVGNASFSCSSGVWSGPSGETCDRPPGCYGVSHPLVWTGSKGSCAEFYHPPTIPHPTSDWADGEERFLNAGYYFPGEGYGRARAKCQNGIITTTTIVCDEGEEP